MMAIQNRGLHDDRIGRQYNPGSNPDILYDSAEIMPYLESKISDNTDTKKQII